MPLNENQDQCTATAKSTGERCQNPAVEGWDVCRLHGAGTPKRGTSGGADPKHGRYAAKRSESLQEKIQEYREDTDPAEMWSELAVLRACLQEWLGKIEELDEDAVGVLLDLQDSIRRTLDTINRMQNRSALTAAEVDYLQSAMADVLKSYVPESNRDDALRQLRSIVHERRN